MMRPVITWHLKESLVAYMSADPGFVVDAHGGAEWDGHGTIRLPAEVDSDGVATAVGSVVLSAHGGALALPLRDVTMDSSAIWIRDPLDEATSPRRLRLVQITEVASLLGHFDSTLADEACGLFVYYAVGTPFGRVILSKG